MRFCIHSSQYNPQIHTVISGPYNESSCGGGCNSITSTSTSTTATTTQNPNSVVPPLVNGSIIFNLNDSPVFVSTQYTTDNGLSWTPASSFTLDANTSINIGGNFLYRVNATIAGGPASQWSYEYIYPNPDNILAPIVNGSVIYNSNLFIVYCVLEYSTNAGGSWTPHSSFTLDANTSITVGGNFLYRARFAQAGLGTSVSSWSSW